MSSGWSSVNSRARVADDQLTLELSTQPRALESVPENAPDT